MNFIPYIFLAYGLLLFLGGFIGYAQTGSIASVISGLLAEILSIFGGVGMIKRIPYSDIASIILTVLFTLFFSYRYWVTHKVMPGLVFAILSFLMTLALFYYTKRKQNKIR